MVNSNELYISLNPNLLEKIQKYVDLLKEQALRVFKKPKPSSLKTSEIAKNALELFLDNAFEEEKLLSCGLIRDIKKFDFDRYRFTMEQLKTNYALTAGLEVTDETLISHIVEAGLNQLSIEGKINLSKLSSPEILDAEIILNKKSKTLIKKLKKVLIQIDPPVSDSELINNLLEKYIPGYILDLKHKIKFAKLKHKLISENEEEKRNEK